MASKKKARPAAKKSSAKRRPAPPAKKSKAKAKKSKPAPKVKAKSIGKKSAPAVAKAKPSVKAAKATPKPKPKPAAKAAPKVNLVSIGEGDKAPSFELADQNGEQVSSTTLAGEPYVLYFYPKDDTPGCTVEACGFRDSLSNFTARGVRVIGVSPDSVQSHGRFRDKHELNFTLLSDPEKQLAQAFGVWVKKQNYGREYMGIERSTFIVDPDGIVHKAWKGVRVPGHVDQVLEAVRSLR